MLLRLLLLLLAVLSGLLVAPARAEDVLLRVCTADQPFYPFTLPDGSGQHQFLLRLAARGLPLRLHNYMARVRAACRTCARAGPTRP